MSRLGVHAIGILPMLLASLLLPAGGSGQEPDVIATSVPQDVAEHVVAFLNDPGTIRFNGPSRIPAGRAVDGDVGVLGGSLVVAGEVDGRLMVVNGNLEFLEGGRVTGDVVLVGGRVLGRTVGEIGGSLTVYADVLRLVERAGRVELSARQLREFNRREGVGRATFSVRAGTNYNRVEGLPVMFGPVYETARPRSTRVEALGIWRSETGLALRGDELGYRLVVEQHLGGEGSPSLGATLHSSLEPMSHPGLSDLESSLATFFLRQDFRDYFDRTGWGAFATLRAPALPLSLRLEVANETHRFARVGSPWTLTRNDEAWRPQPLVAEGRLWKVAGELAFDDRNDRADPTDGWWVRARVIRGLSGTLTVPEHVQEVEAPEGEAPVAARLQDARFTALTLDARRYLRVDPESDVSVRLFVGGSLDGGALPPQYQHALGGKGTLPGYPLLSRDCGARERVFLLPAGSGASERVFPRYGCDRAALLQLQYRRRLLVDVAVSPGEEGSWEWHPAVDLSPSWTAFVNAGRGWSLSDPAQGSAWVTDVGLGLLFGDLGLYTALPLQGQDRSLEFFVRVSRPF